MVESEYIFALHDLSKFSGAAVSQSVLVELNLPEDWSEFRMPPALHHRLQVLLDRQDCLGKLTPSERREARALTQLVDLLSLMKLRAESAAKRDGS
jgi:hypothetical protein